MLSAEAWLRMTQLFCVWMIRFLHDAYSAFALNNHESRFCLNFHGKAGPLTRLPAEALLSRTWLHDSRCFYYPVAAEPREAKPCSALAKSRTFFSAIF